MAKNKLKSLKVGAEEIEFLRDVFNYECPPNRGCVADRERTCIYSYDGHGNEQGMPACDSMWEQIESFNSCGTLKVIPREKTILGDMCRAYIKSGGEYKKVGEKFLERL